jgi:hypothetical protein
LALIRAILRKACFEWEWLDRVPKVKLYREGRRRVRWFLQEMGAWETASMVRRYAHLAPGHLAPHAAVVDRVLDGTSTAQSRKETGEAEQQPLV